MLNLITNRPNSDTYYNATDLNRVEAATATLAGLLTAAGYTVTIITKTDWEMSDLPYDTDMQRYLANINRCIEQYHAVPGITLPETMVGLDYIGANNIEKVLEGLNILIERMVQGYRYSGGFDFYSGTDIVLP